MQQVQTRSRISRIGIDLVTQSLSLKDSDFPKIYCGIDRCVCSAIAVLILIVIDGRAAIDTV